ncbi:MAG: hypothetical protein KDB35_04420 [Acidimicrobiales bacterium]|nr:hypothetical protein [Acidimicrobiales bacterium]MCB1016514.1 hypothetical protein [Acidimicrobiales bacterium]MCB9371729.1 hypothetical protein [Microthrixaceae bacterium]
MDAVLLAAKVWHFWIAPAVVALVVVAIIATIVGYLVKVVAPKYPRS